MLILILRLRPLILLPCLQGRNWGDILKRLFSGIMLLDRCCSVESTDHKYLLQEEFQRGKLTEGKPQPFPTGLLSYIFQGIWRSIFPDSAFRSAVQKAESRVNHSIDIHRTFHIRTTGHFISVSPPNGPETR